MFVYTKKEVFVTNKVKFNKRAISFMVREQLHLEWFEDILHITEKAINPIDTGKLVKGAILIAHSPVPMKDGSGNCFTVGGEYVIGEIDEDIPDEFHVIDDQGHAHHFDFYDVDVYFTLKAD